MISVDHVEVVPLEVPLARTFAGSYYSMSERATLITRIRLSNGVVGESYNGDEIHTQHEIARIITDELIPLLSGVDASLVERCWDRMLAPTRDILRDRRLVLMAMACVDSALWDALGKMADTPLYRLWGGAATELGIVAIGGYYQMSHAELEAEVHQYLEMGIGGCKMKVGSASPREDADRFIAMREAAGDEPFLLMADANQGYDPTDAVEFARLVSDHDLRWFEEPVRWENADNWMRDVRAKTGVPIAAGQSEMARAQARQLITAGAIDVCNFDASWSGGPTEWRRVAGLAACHGVQMAHHEEPQIAAHLLGSVSHGTYVEVFHPDRDPIFWNLIANRSDIASGRYTIPTGPGLGLELDEAFIDRYRVDR